MIFLHILLALLSLVLLFVVLWFAFYFVISILVDTKKEYTDNNKFYRHALNFATLTGIIVLRIKLKVSGKEKLDKNQNYYFVSNHRSNLDPILSWYVFKEHNIAFLSKPENFKVLFFGKIIHRCCFLPIHKDDIFQAMESVNKAAKVLEKGELSFGVYPEGKRHTEAEMAPFHNGVFRAAQKANKPIAVIAVRNADDINRNYPFKSTTIYIDVLEIIPAEEIKGVKTNIIGDRVRKILEDHLYTK